MNERAGLTLRGMSDEELLKYLNTPKHKLVYSLLYERYEKKVYFKCISMLKNQSDARDLTHDIFIKVFTKIDQFKGKSKLSFWIHSIAVHACLSFLKNKNKVRQIIVSEEQAELGNLADDGDEALYSKMLIEIKLQDLERLMGKLKEEHRLVLIMKYLDGMSINEIAEILNIGISAVKMKLKRTREKLYELYTNEKSCVA